MIHYGQAPFPERFPRSRVPSYPRHKGPLVTEVAIVGGGLTGCATAYAFAAAGIGVTLVEADRIGGGATSAVTGWISDDPGAGFTEVEKLIGLRAARHAFQAWRRAALDFSALLRRLEIQCHLEPHTALTVAFTPEQVSRLRREQKARVEAGLEAPVLNGRAVTGEVGLGAGLGLRGRDGATIDPYRACLGLAKAAVERGAQIFERSAMKRITFNRKTADVHTAAGAIHAKRVVIATAMPSGVFQSLARHFWFRTSYLALTEPVPAKIRRALGRRATVVRDSADPPHIVRWLDDERLMVVGADTETPPARLKSKVVVQRTMQLMYELSVLYPEISGIQPGYGWSVDYTRTAEGLPYFGPHRNFPHQLFAFGDSSHGVTGAYLASRILLRHHLGEADPSDLAFEFTR
jgi:glycine/D-amino acid oxidase-like deaminating enzyme